jgi:hypothetical protein
MRKIIVLSFLMISSLNIAMGAMPSYRALPCEILDIIIFGVV